MRGRGHLAVVLGTALVLSFGCGPTVVGEVVDDEEVAAAGLVYVTTRDAAVPLVEELLGPVLEDETPRLVESTNGNSILLVEEERLAELAEFFHENFHRCGGFASHTTLAEARSSITADPGDTAGPADDEVLLAGEPEAINRMLPLLDRTRLLATIMGLSSYPTRYYTSASGVNSMNWLRDRWNELAAGKSYVTVALRTHTGWAQPSVMMTIQGTDLADEYVVVGGHGDSISFGGNAPGADDDASGVATFTEIARVLLADGVRFRRTVVFIAYAAEEVGLRGSNEIADQWAAEGRNVRGVMQLDMTAFRGTPTADIVLFEDYTSATMTDALESLANTYLPELVISRDSCGYACSDHAPWFENGFPTVLPFESQMDDYNPNIHTSGDTMAFFGNNADHAIKFAKLGLAWVVQQARVSGAAPTGVVRLAQVAYDIPGLEAPGEFVELYNTGTTAINVSGWTLTAGTKIRTLPNGTTVPPGDYLSLARDADGFATLYGQPADLQRCPPLPNGATTLTLRNGSGATVDEVRWESTGWNITATAGSSLYRTNPGGTDSNTVSDWSVAASNPH
jgi:bacterial leucyl aminopeptidase